MNKEIIKKSSYILMLWIMFLIIFVRDKFFLGVYEFYLADVTLAFTISVFSIFVYICISIKYKQIAISSILLYSIWVMHWRINYYKGSLIFMFLAPMIPTLINYIGLEESVKFIIIIRNYCISLFIGIAIIIVAYLSIFLGP
ncbi:hypothetical protein [Anaerophilus nitritogenes]|uniref:hypothetical protein n=1 Tax=Anaerophilus nitritogenes TaxID=2498136 RepID=UPI00101B63F3|nr:hypothetical protein [Anaerophilus nitritogenes]